MSLKPPVDPNAPLAAGRVLYNAVADFGAGNGSDDTTAIQAAITAAKNDGGGVVFLPTGSYYVTDTLTLDGVSLVGAARGAGSGDAATTTINKAFNGNLIQFTGGGMVQNLVLESVGDYTGAAVYALATASNNIVGRIFLSNLTITYDTSSSANRWERGINFDGSPNGGAAVGIRDCAFHNIQVFECETAGESVVLNRCVVFDILGLHLLTTTGTPSMGIKVVHNDSRNLTFAGCLNPGTFTSDAAAFLTYYGYIGGNITCNSGSDHNVYTGHVTAGTFTNNGGTNNRREASTTISSTWTASQHFKGGIGGDSSVARLKVSGSQAGTAGVVELYDRLSVATSDSFGSFAAPPVGAMITEKGYLFREQTEPTNPASDRGHLYCKDNGSGKTQLCVRFATGASVVIATEP